MASDRSGRREVSQGQESMVITKRPPSSGNRFLRHSNSSSLEILEPEDSLKIGSNHGKNFHKENRPSSTGKKNSGSVPPRPDSTLTRRTPTPTKQISLQAVRRKEDNDDPIVADIDWKELQSHSRNKGRKDVPTTQLQEMSLSENPRKSDKSSIPFSYSSNHHNCSHHHVEKPERREEERVNGASKSTKESQKKETREKSPEQITTKPEEEEEEDSSSSDEEEEERKAPNQLLMEFVTSLMEKDYVSAEKLCKMILLYEPDNPEALKFQPLIEEKIALDNEPEYESGESEGEEGYDDKDDEDDDDEDDDGTEDDDSDSSDSDSDSDSDEDDSEQEEQRVDSGIASAAGSEFNV